MSMLTSQKLMRNILEYLFLSLLTTTRRHTTAEVTPITEATIRLSTAATLYYTSESYLRIAMNREAV